MLYRPNHPHAQKSGYIPEHRIIYEEFYNCCLLPWVLIHHINGVRNDNRIENLKPLIKPKHAIVHHFAIRHRNDIRQCVDCHSYKTYINPRTFKNGTWSATEEWYKVREGGFVCKKCHHKRKRSRQVILSP